MNTGKCNIGHPPCEKSMAGLTGWRILHGEFYMNTGKCNIGHPPCEKSMAGLTGWRILHEHWEV